MNHKYLFFILFFLIFISFSFIQVKALEIGEPSTLPYVDISETGCSNGYFISSINFDDQTFKCKAGNNASGNLSYEVDPVWNAASINVARTGSASCPVNQYVAGVQTTTVGVTLHCIPPYSIPEVDPYWSSNQSHYFNKTDINSTYVPYARAINFVDLNNNAIVNTINLTTKKLVIENSVASSRVNSFITSAAQHGDIEYTLPVTLPPMVPQYLQSDNAGRLQWATPTSPAETDPKYVADNNTIIKSYNLSWITSNVGNYSQENSSICRQGSITCGAGTFLNSSIVNSSGVFGKCEAISQTPALMISAFDGQVCPSGWILTNGTAYVLSNGTTYTTKDLRDRFIVSGGTVYVNGTSGGVANHTHQYTPAGTVTLAFSPGTTVNTALPNAKVAALFAGLSANTLGQDPPYYSLIYCMKT